MELALALNRLWHRRIWVALGVIVAAAVAIESSHALKKTSYGTASTQMVVDAPTSALGNLKTSLVPYTARAIVYARLTNAPVTLMEALPGALVAAVTMEASFQGLPLFVRYASVNVTLRAFGGPVLLLIWLYVMANVIVFGGELNWWWRERQRARAEAPAQPARDVSAPSSTRSPIPPPSTPHHPE